MLKEHNFNFYAGEDIEAHTVLDLDASNSDGQHICVGPADGLNIVGFANRDAAAGDEVDFIEFKVGQVVNLVAGGSISAGEYLIVSDGTVVSAGEGASGTMPLMAIDDASEGDVIRVICGTFTAPAASDAS